MVSSEALFSQFGSQEPGTDEEIGQFCELNHGVTFPLMKKSDVNGDNQNEVCGFITARVFHSDCFCPGIHLAEGRKEGYFRPVSHQGVCTANTRGKSGEKF